MTRGNDGWQIVHRSDGWVALFTPDIDDPGDTFPPKHTFSTRDDAVAYAEGNYTAHGIVGADL